MQIAMLQQDFPILHQFHFGSLENVKIELLTI